MTAPPSAAVNSQPGQDAQQSFVSLTRLRLRSIRYVPAFAVHAIRTRQQCSRAAGFQRGSLLMDRKWTFWTLTVWDTQESMRAYMTTGDHKRAMPKLLDWCDQASVAHWFSDAAELPTWQDCDRRMRTEGRTSKVRNPAAGHADMTFAAPRTTRGGSIVAAR